MWDELRHFENYQQRQGNDCRWRTNCVSTAESNLARVDDVQTTMLLSSNPPVPQMTIPTDKYAKSRSFIIINRLPLHSPLQNTDANQPLPTEIHLDFGMICRTILLSSGIVVVASWQAERIGPLHATIDPPISCFEATFRY